MPEQQAKLIAHQICFITAPLFTEPVDDDTIEAAHALSKAIKTASPSAILIWGHLTEKVQNLFHALTPCLRLVCTIPKRGGTQLLTFSDGHTFSVKRAHRAVDARASLAPTTLIQTGKAPYKELERLGQYTQSIPKELYEGSEIGTLQDELETFRGSPYIYREISLQLKHQMSVIKKTYIDNLLSSLGVPVCRSFEVSRKGEWVIRHEKDLKSLSDIDFTTYTEEHFERFSSSLRSIFAFEKQYGISVLGKMDALWVTDAADLVLDDPTISLEFLPQGISRRHEDLKEEFKKILPEKLFGLCFDQPVNHSYPSEDVATFITALVDKGVIQWENLIEGSLEATQIVKKLTPSHLADQESIPWERLRHAHDLLTYLLLTREKVKLPSKRPIPHTVVSILDNIPTKRKPEGSQAAFRQNVGNIVEKDLKLRDTLRAQIFGSLLKSFVENPHVSPLTRFFELKESVNNVVKRQLESTNTPVFPEFDEDADRYLEGIIWTPLKEQLNSVLAMDRAPLTLEQKIVLLRAAYLCAENQESKLELINAKLFATLHPYASAHERAARLDIYKARFNAVIN